MAFASACLPSGDAKFSAAAARRDASVSPSSSPTSTPARKPNFSFSRRQRLTRGADIQAVIREGKRVRTSYLDVRAAASPLDYPRVGFVVPKYDRSAVERNRLKRRLRELTRVRLLHELPASLDVVIRARKETYGIAFADLERDVDRMRAALRAPSRSE